PAGNGARSRQPTVRSPGGHRRGVGAVRQLRPSDTFRPVSNGEGGSFQPVLAGSALGTEAGAASTPTQIPHRGGPTNPSVEALRQQFSGAVQRADVVWGETTVVVDGARVHDVIQWLHDDPSQRYDYLSDVTAVEFRDLEQPLEVVWHLRS